MTNILSIRSLSFGLLLSCSVFFIACDKDDGADPVPDRMDFLGTYTFSETCDGVTQNSDLVITAPQVGGDSALQITVNTFTVFSGMITGATTFDIPRQIDANGQPIYGSGTVVVDEVTVTKTIETSVSDVQCSGSGTRK